MDRGFSFSMTAERSRNKERLEASLAWLCELELLKQRQESLVLGALSLGDTVPGHPAWGDLQPPRSALSGPSREQEDLTLRRQLNSLQGAPWGLMLSLEQQVRELSVDADGTRRQSPGEDGDSRISSGFYEQSESQSPPGCSSSSPGWAFTSHRPKSVDGCMMTSEGLMEPSPRATLPRSFSAPYPPLEGIAEGTGEEEEEEEDEGRWPGEEEPTEEDMEQALRVEAYILGLLQRRALEPPPSPPCSDSAAVARNHPDPPLTPELCDLPPGRPECQAWVGTSEEEPDEEVSLALEEYYLSLLYPQPRPPSLGSTVPGPPLGLEQHGGVEPCTDSPQHYQGYREPRSAVLDTHPQSRQHAHACHAHTRSPLHSATEPHEPSWSPLCPQRAPPRSMPKTCPEGRWTSPREARQRTTSRSQSENSLLGRGWRGAMPPRGYYTVERGSVGRQAGGGPPPAGSLAHRRWSSSTDLSQEEEPALAVKPSHQPWYPHTHTHTCTHTRTCPQYREDARGEEGAEAAPPAPAEGSDSSLSEAYSPGSSSLSSDSDECGGLVWPQQLPPRLAHSSPPAPSSTSVIKIKASHALKKKIMRFRSGSLKVMTTV